MEIRVLRYFLTVVREESITKASEVLHITQPTLSRQLAQMEEDIGVKLFDRGTRKIKLTNEGILLRRRAEEILQLVDKTEKELVEQEEQVEGKISIGCGEIAAVQLLPKIIESFRRKYPRVTFDIFTATADLVKEQMEKGLLDIGLLLEPVDMEKYEFIRLNIREKWVVLMRSDDPLSKKETVSAKDLSVLPLILPRRMNVQSELASWFGNYYEKLDIVFTSNLSTNSAIMVNGGLAYSLVIEGAVPFWDQSKVTFRPLDPPLTATSVLAWKRGQPFSLATIKFIKHIQGGMFAVFFNWEDAGHVGKHTVCRGGCKHRPLQSILHVILRFRLARMRHGRHFREQSLQRQRRRNGRDHDEQDDRREIHGVHNADLQALLGNDQRDLAAGHHADADLEGIAPVEAADLCSQTAADDLGQQGHQNKADAEQENFRRQAADVGL